MLRDRRVKLDSSAITRIEGGAREPRLREAVAIAEVLGFTLSTSDLYEIDGGERQFATSEELMKREMSRARRRILGICHEQHVAFDGLFGEDAELQVLGRRGVTTATEWAQKIRDEMVQRFSVDDESGRANYVFVTDPIHREMLEILISAVTANLYKTEEEIFETTEAERELYRQDIIRRARESLIEAYGQEEFTKRFGSAFENGADSSADT